MNEHKFLAFLNRVVSFDLFRPKPLYGYGFTETPAYNEYFERLGYLTSNIYENLGAIPLVGLLLGVLMMLKTCLALISLGCKSSCFANVNNCFFWPSIVNFCVRFFLVTFFEYAIAIFVGLRFRSEIKD